MRKSFCIVFGLLALVLESCSLFLALDEPGPGSAVLAFVLHLCAVAASFLAARVGVARGGREFDAVIVTALVVPLFGPALAWMMPVRSDAEADAAKEMLEQVESRMDHAEDYSRPFFLGDFEKDLARQLNSVSYYEVLEKGDLEQKRDALRKLARLGEPQHMALVARTLEDPDTELRLCAYLELDRVRQRHERGIAELADRVRGFVAWTEWLEAIADAPRDENGKPNLQQYPPPEQDRACLDADIDELRAALARAHLEYAISGTLDDTMRDFRLERCLEECRLALELEASNGRALVIMARAHCERGARALAEAALARLPEDVQRHRVIRELKARIRFDAGDFQGAREIGYEILEAREEPPSWLFALCAEHAPELARAGRLEPDAQRALEDELEAKGIDLSAGKPGGALLELTAGGPA